VTEKARHPDGSQSSPLGDVSIIYGFLRSPNFRGFGKKGDVFEVFENGK